MSLAAAHAAADHCGLPLYRYLGGPGARLLPVPLMNIINGGAHADNAVDVQEFMVVPLGFDSFREALRAGVETFHQLKKVLKGKKLNTSVGDEGGFAPDLQEQCRGDRIDYRSDPASGLQAGRANCHRPSTSPPRSFTTPRKRPTRSKAATSIRPAWSICWPAGSKNIRSARSKTAAAKTIGKAGSCSASGLGNRVQLVGDDMFVTNTKRLQRGIDDGIANSILIKVNQIGTLTETIEAVQLATRNGYTNVMSHRSGETEDSTIADLAVALGTGQIKTGSASRTDRMAKYNQLLRIEEDLAGRRGLRRPVVQAALKKLLWL